VTNSLARLTAALADRYTIERELGAGGMATVYLAEDVKHHRKVAVKVLKPELAAVLGAERFVQEITTTAALQHPHILPLFDSGTADSFLFYVMPFIQGETLRSKLDRETQLGIDEAVRIASEVADALDYAHRHGVIHRDIKPENILLHEGRPMVADFGIALALSAAAGGRMTETGLSLGTPHYMSPEQATAEKEISARSDIYSLGSVLYEMLAGQPPHLGGSAQQIIMKIIAEGAKPVTEHRKSVPSNVAAAVARSLEKLPADRFETAKAFAEALADPHYAMAAGRGAVVPAGGLGARRVTLALAGLLAVMTAVAVWALLRAAPPGPVTRYGLSLPVDQAPLDGGYVLVTSDGSRIVYLGPSAQSNGSQLWVKERDHLTATPLAGTESALSAAVSPDNAWLAVAQGGRLRKLPIAGGALIPLADQVSNASGSVAWLDDGRIAFVTQETSTIAIVPEAGGEVTVVWSKDSLNLSNLTPLPGGRGLLFQGCFRPCDQTSVWALDLRTRSAQPVLPGAHIGYFVPTGHLVYVRGDQTALAVPFDLKSLRTRGTPIVAFDSIALNQGLAPFFSVSPRGTVVMRTGEVATSGEFRLAWVDRTGGVTAVDTSFTFRVTQFAGNHGWALSPDGHRLAIGLNTPAGDDIWIKPLPRGPASRVTYGASTENRPRWRADGRWVTFVRPDGVFQHRADGTGTDSLLLRGAHDEAVVSPDGAWIVFRRGASSAAAGGRDIYGVRLGVDSAPVPLVVTPFDEMAIGLSPDGHWLAYQSDETGRTEVYIRPFPNTNDAKVQISSSGGTGPLWSRNGRELFYLRGDETMMAAAVTTTPTLRADEPRALFHLPPDLARLLAAFYTPWDVGPDGRFIMAQAVERGPSRGSPLIVVENWLVELKALEAR